MSQIHFNNVLTRTKLVEKFSRRTSQTLVKVTVLVSTGNFDTQEVLAAL